jgi:hypothetical protein
MRQFLGELDKIVHAAMRSRESALDTWLDDATVPEVPLLRPTKEECFDESLGLTHHSIEITTSSEVHLYLIEYDLRVMRILCILAISRLMFICTNTRLHT